MLAAKQKPLAETGLAPALNDVLKQTLTGINQYFLHARMLKHMGFMKLADYEYKESLAVMKYTDQLVNHILSLDALPNLQELGQLRIGDAAMAILKNDLTLVEYSLERAGAAMEAAREAKNATALATLDTIVKGESEHEQFLRAQLDSINTMGLNAYLQTQI